MGKRGGDRGGRGGRGGRKKAWAQPNLHRAQQAVLRLVGEAAGPSKSGKNALANITSRKEARKQARKLKHAGKAALNSEKAAAGGEAGDNGDGKAKKKRKKRKNKKQDGESTSKDAKRGSSTDASAHASKRAKSNPHREALMQRLQDAGLIGSGDEEERLDEDDRTIREMEKKLGVKDKRAASLFAAEDPLRDLFMFADKLTTDEADEGDEGGKEGGEHGSGGAAADAGGLEGEDEAATGGGMDMEALFGDLEGLEELAEDGEGMAVMHEGDDSDGNGDGGGDDEEGDGEAGLKHSGGSNARNKGQHGNGAGDAARESEDPATDSSKVVKTDIYGRPIGEAKTKYIPPALRKRMMEGDASKEDAGPLGRRLRGLLNRLNQSNLSDTIRQVAETLRTESINIASGIISRFVLDACARQERTLGHLLGVYAAAVAALHSIIDDNKVSGQFLQATMDKFHALYKKQEGQLKNISKDGSVIVEELAATVDKRPLNTAAVMALLYHFGVVKSSFIFELLDMFTGGDEMTALDVELILEVLRTCGAKLRQEDSDGLRDIFNKMKTRAAASSICTTSRVRFMLESIQDLQAKKGRILKDNREQLKPLVKAVSACRRTHRASARPPLNVTMDDLLDAEKRGRWWMVGAAWHGRSDDRRGDRHTVGGAGDADMSAVIQLAETMRMNTEVRRRVFVAIMTAEDCLDAITKLYALKDVKGPQQREFVRVAVDCCLQERTFNGYYAALISNLCPHAHEHRRTMTFCLWDRLRDIESMDSVSLDNLQQLLAFVVAKNALTLGVLKHDEVLPLPSLSPRMARFLQRFFTTLLTKYSSDNVKHAFERINDKFEVKNRLLVFFTHYMYPPAELVDDAKQGALLKNRVALATSLLEQDGE